MPNDASSLARCVAETMRKKEGPTALFDIALDGVGEGWAKTSMTLDAHMLNGFGNAHGGILFLLADTAFAYACNARNVATVSQACSISFLSPGRSGERIAAEAKRAGEAGRAGVYDVQIFGEDGRVVAIFQGLSRSLNKAVIDSETGELVVR